MINDRRGRVVGIPQSGAIAPDVGTLLTVITVVWNGKNVIERTIRSVLDQPYGKIEYIIVDGGSTDGTVDIIRKYENRIACWVSEPDNGIYYAMNKAINMMGGEGHLFLNAGDYLCGDVFGAHPQIPSFIPVHYRRFHQRREQLQNVRDYRQGMPYCHQGILFQSKGVLFDTSYRFAADYQYYLDHGYRKRLPFTPAPGYVHYDNTGLSMRNAADRDRELSNIIKKNFGYGQYLRFQTVAGIKKVGKKVLIGLRW